MGRPVSLNVTEIIISNSHNDLGLDHLAWYPFIFGFGVRKTRNEMEEKETGDSMGEICDDQVTLKQFPGKNQEAGRRMFFLETSGKPTLSPRQACTLESDAKFSGLHPTILLTSPFLDLTNSNTCSLYTKLTGLVDFFTMNTTSLLQDTPLEGMTNTQGTLANSKYPATQTSDAVRLALVYKEAVDMAIMIHSVSSFIFGGRQCVSKGVKKWCEIKKQLLVVKFSG